MLEDSSRQNCATVVCFALWVARCQQKKISPRQNCTRVVSRLVACRHLPNHHLGTHPPPTTGIFYKMILNLHIFFRSWSITWRYRHSHPQNGSPGQQGRPCGRDNPLTNTKIEKHKFKNVKDKYTNTCRRDPCWNISIPGIERATDRLQMIRIRGYSE